MLQLRLKRRDRRCWQLCKPRLQHPRLKPHMASFSPFPGSSGNWAALEHGWCEHEPPGHSSESPREALGRAECTHRAVQTWPTQLISQLLQQMTHSVCFTGHRPSVRLWSNSSEVKGRNHYPHTELILNSNERVFTEKLKKWNEGSVEARAHMFAGKHYRHFISIESATEAGRKGLEGARPWID